MKLKSASAYRLRDRYLICPNIRTTKGLWMNSAPYVTLPLDADPGLLGRAILTALEGSAQGAPHPTDFRAASELRRSAAGVRSERQFQLGASYIGISIDGDNLRLLPYRNGGSKGDQKGFSPSPEQERSIEMRSGADEVGAMFMEVLSSLQGSPAISPKATVFGGMARTPESIRPLHSMPGPMTHAPKLADRIWNRACAGGEQAARGDSALAALLAFHSPAMNGGVLHALECLNRQAVSAAMAGYAFYGFPAVASLLERGARRVEEAVDLELLEAELDEEYGVHIPDDSVIVQAFEDHLRRSPADFAPLE